MEKLDPNITVNPQILHIAQENKNLAFIKIKKKELHTVVMLPYENGIDPWKC
jgi:predicted transport protein